MDCSLVENDDVWGVAMGVRSFWDAEKHQEDLSKACWVVSSNDFHLDFVIRCNWMLWRSSAVFRYSHHSFKKSCKIPFPSGCHLKRKNLVINQHQGQPGSLSQGFKNSLIWPSISPLVRWRVTRMDRKPPGMFWKLMDTLTTWELLDAWMEREGWVSVMVVKDCCDFWGVVGDYLRGFCCY